MLKHRARKKADVNSQLNSHYLKRIRCCSGEVNSAAIVYATFSEGRLSKPKAAIRAPLLFTTQRKPYLRLKKAASPASRSELFKKPEPFRSVP